MVHSVNTEKNLSINRIPIAERAFPEDVDKPSPYSAIFISGTRELNLSGTPRDVFHAGI